MELGLKRYQGFSSNIKIESTSITFTEWLFEAYPLDELGITIWARCYRKHVCIFANSEFVTTHRNDDITKCGIHLVYRGDKVFEEARPMTSAEYVAASSAIAQVQAKYDELSLIAQKDTIYKNYARKKGHKRKSAVLSSDNERRSRLRTTIGESRQFIDSAYYAD